MGSALHPEMNHDAVESKPFMYTNRVIDTIVLLSIFTIFCHYIFITWIKRNISDASSSSPRMRRTLRLLPPPANAPINTHLPPSQTEAENFDGWNSALRCFTTLFILCSLVSILMNTISICTRNTCYAKGGGHKKWRAPLFSSFVDLSLCIFRAPFFGICILDTKIKKCFFWGERARIEIFFLLFGAPFPKKNNFLFLCILH